MHREIVMHFTNGWRRWDFDRRIRRRHGPNGARPGDPPPAGAPCGYQSPVVRFVLHATRRRVYGPSPRPRPPQRRHERKWFMTPTPPAATAIDGFTVAGLIRRLAQSRSDHEMLVAGEIRRTWSDEYRRACQVAQACQRDGLRADDRVALLDRNGLPYFDVLFGGALIGAVNVAVNWRLAPLEMAAIIDDSAARILVVHGDYVPALELMPSGLPAVQRIVVVDDPGAPTTPCPDRRAITYAEWLDGCPETDPGHVGRPDDVSMQLYTSGTTGLPKGVMLT